jgi:SNF2 family DNA or RNA helicase
MRFVAEKYQDRAIEFAANRDSVCIGMDTGLGKTATTLELLSRWFDALKITRVLIVAPPNVVNFTWDSEIEKFSESFGWMNPIKLIGTPKRREKLAEQDALVYIISYNNFRWLLQEFKNEWKWDCIVFDEISRMKSPSSKRFKAFRHMKQHVNHVIGLSGTISPNGYLDLWAQSFCLDGGIALGRTYTGYRNRYFFGDFLGYTYKLLPGAKEEIEEKIKPNFFTMSKDDYLTLPKLNHINIEVELPAHLRPQYLELKKKLELTLEGGTLIDAENSVQHKLRQFCNGFLYDENKKKHALHDVKLQALESLIEEANGEPVIVGYQFIPDKEAIIKKFGNKVTLLNTKDPDLLNKWNRGEIPILLMYGSGETHGLNLQYACNKLIHFGNTWDYEAHYQLESRIYRKGQEKPVFIYNIILKDTIESAVIGLLNKKHKENTELTKVLKL